ncbi:8-amino-7-oxononanoate synthase [Thiolapillus brandeum]|uniref:8-amino-7-oxononanoate synthase n=1 Tax=Thiolapillus brandeum TaxID=1076588 RepID=A0A7U6JJH5_9GAMM|nr:8-amino-7-oxononanoate synthase [Thiolapillus brandeum]BAO44965.1 8-amino-7-oxononanoate synthase [Thiolapillus brandeum]
MKDLRPALVQAQQGHLYRRRRVLDSPQQPRLVVEGRPLLSFCSNDYLGLAADPRVSKAFHRGLEHWGSGSGSAHLVSGHSRAHHALEEELADFTGRERALLFSSGYLANLAVVTSLCGRGDTVIQDKLDHASLIDAARLSGAGLKRYAHNDMAAARQRLAAARGEVLLAVDGVFSMDGDLAPLPELADLASQHGAWLMVDDAHGLGVLGAGGRGSLAHFGLDADHAPVLMGTLGKAFGTAGAFVAGSEALIETLIQKARSYIFTTALPAALAEATRASLEILRAEEWRRERLASLVARFRRGAAEMGFKLSASATPVQPLIAGRAQTALAWSRLLEEQGILVTAIRPPTVPKGSARLRITFSAAHEDRDLDQLLAALESLKP